MALPRAAPAAVRTVTSHREPPLRVTITQDSLTRVSF
jgi:hypothetical protein